MRVVAGADQARVTISINGKPRWIEADVTATVSGGAGVKDVWVTSAADSFSYTGDDEIDGTDHSFALKVGSTPSGSGAETNFRKVGEVDWDGSKITGLRQSFGNGAMVHVLGQNADVAPIYAKGVASQAKLIRLDDDSAAEQFSVTGAGVVNAKTGYKVNGTDLASTHLSDGSTLAPKASPALTGTPTAPTPATLDDTTKIATTAFVNASINERGATIAQRTVLDTGLVGQTRAGRTLAASDFTDIGDANLVALWGCNGLTDLSANALSLTNKGSVPFGVGVDGAASSAAVFAGSTSQALYRADTGGADPLRIQYGSIGGWTKSAKSATFQALVSKFRVTGSQRSFWLGMDSGANSVGRVQFSTDGTTNLIVNGITDLSDDRWHFLVAVYDGLQVKLYVDGVLEGSVNAAGATLFGGTAPLNIGGYDADGSTAASNPHYGRVDEAFVTGSALTAEQIRALYCVGITHGGASPKRVGMRVSRSRRGAALANADFPSNPAAAYNFAAGSLSELNGGTSFAATGGVDQAPGPDGVAKQALSLQAGNYLQRTDTGLPSGLTTRSYGIWVCTQPHATSYQNFITWGTSGAGRAVAWVDPVTGRLAFGNNGDSVVSSTVVADGRWHSVIVVEDNSAADGVKRKLYMDGRLVAGSTVMATITPAGANAFRIGAELSGAQPFYGLVARPWVHSAALTWDQVQKVYMKSASMLGVSPKDAADHVETIGASSFLFAGDDLEPQWLLDMEVSR